MFSKFCIRSFFERFPCKKEGTIYPLHIGGWPHIKYADVAIPTILEKLNKLPAFIVMPNSVTENIRKHNYCFAVLLQEVTGLSDKSINITDMFQCVGRQEDIESSFILILQEVGWHNFEVAIAKSIVFVQEINNISSDFHRYKGVCSVRERKGKSTQATPDFHNGFANAEDPYDQDSMSVCYYENTRQALWTAGLCPTFVPV